MEAVAVCPFCNGELFIDTVQGPAATHPRVEGKTHVITRYRFRCGRCFISSLPYVDYKNCLKMATLKGGQYA